MTIFWDGFHMVGILFSMKHVLSIASSHRCPLVLHQNIIHSIGFVVSSNATAFLYSSSLKVYTMVGSTARFYVDGMLPLQLLGYAIQPGVH